MNRPTIIIRPGQLPELIAVSVTLLRTGRETLALRKRSFYRRNGRLRIAHKCHFPEQMLDRWACAIDLFVALDQLARWRKVRDGRTVPSAPPKLWRFLTSPEHLSEWAPTVPFAELTTVAS